MMHKLISSLLNFSVSPYDFIQTIKKNNGKYARALRKNLISHSSAYIRLCCAWALGELQNRDSFILLKRAYLNELENNARANIVWALFWIDRQRITQSLFNKFLQDTYYLIPVIALKNIASLYRVEGKIDFLDLYNQADNVLVKLELLRNIRSFKLPSTINNLLLVELERATNVLLKTELVNALALTKRTDSLDILMNYYFTHKETFFRNENLAIHYVSALLSIGQSKPYMILSELYTHHKYSPVKWKIIELLVTAGGPRCIEVLKKLYGNETDPDLKAQIKNFIEITQITVP